MDTIQLVEVNALEESTENNEMPVVGLLACFLWRCVAFTYCFLLPSVTNYTFCQFSWSVYVTGVLYTANSHYLLDLICFSNVSVRWNICSEWKWDRQLLVIYDDHEVTFCGIDNAFIKSRWIRTCKKLHQGCLVTSVKRVEDSSGIPFTSVLGHDRCSSQI